MESGDSGFCDPTPADISLNDHNDLGSKKTNVDEAENSKVDLILEQLELFKHELRDLKKGQEDTKSTTKTSVEEKNSPEVRETLMLLQSSRSMDDIEGIGFEYDEETQKVKCTLCDKQSDDNDKTVANSSGEFRYSPLAGLCFDDSEKLSRKFINLKAHLKAHILKSKSHCLNLMEEKEKNAAECELI